jgi:bromodomain-containing factor 1
MAAMDNPITDNVNGDHALLPAQSTTELLPQHITNGDDQLTADAAFSTVASGQSNASARDEASAPSTELSSVDAGMTNPSDTVEHPAPSSDRVVEQTSTMDVDPPAPQKDVPPENIHGDFPNDQPTAEVRSSQGKNAREREDDIDDGPAAKRTRTDEAGAEPTAELPPETDAPQFKVPELPLSVKTDINASSGDHATAPGPVEERGSSMTKAQHKYLLHALRNLKRNKDAPPFNAPVDPVKLNIPTYFDVIKQPMDFSTMEDKLKRSVYVSVDEYVADFNQIVKNTIMFNGLEHVVTRQAQNLEIVFEKQMTNLPQADVEEPPPANKKGKKPPAAPKPASTARRESRSSGGAAGSPINKAGSPTTTFALGPSGTPLIRRDSTAGDGRPKREIHPPPPRDLPYATAKPKKKKFQWELKFCQEVLDELHKPVHRPVADPFLKPVDPVALNIPHYHKVVKKPMDLSTIKAKLKNGDYENSKEFEADIRLMFNNCYRFNPVTDPVHQMGKRLHEIFNNMWAQKRQWLEDHVPASGRPSPSVAEPEVEDDDEEEEDEEEDDVEQLELKALQKQIAGLSKQVELIQQKKSKGSPPAQNKKKGKAGKPDKKTGKKKSGSASATNSASVSGGAASEAKKKKAKPKPKTKQSTPSTAASKKERTPYVTYEQKQEISNRINTLPASKMTLALNIIRDHMPSLKVRLISSSCRVNAWGP